jgi:hypothetical protein
VNIDIISLIFMILIVGFIVYLAHIYWFDYPTTKKIVVGPLPASTNMAYMSQTPIVPLQMGNGNIGGIATRLDVFNDPYIPPVKMDGYIWEKTSGMCVDSRPSFHPWKFRRLLQFMVCVPAVTYL